MAVQLYRLMEQVAHMDITLLGGKEGLGNLVSWVHMSETLESSDFLEGGEIVFATGLGLGENLSLLDLVQGLHARNAAGIIINTGPFLNEIPPHVIAFCDEHHFPLFTVPWRIHLAEIMRIFCYSITKDDQKHLETASAFKNAIFFPKQEELYVIPLSQQGFQVDWNYCVSILILEHPSGQPATRIQKLTMALDNYLQHKYGNFALFSNNMEILAVTANYDHDQLHAFVDDLQYQARRSLSREEDFSMGVGKLTRSIRCLYKSYRQAKSIQKLQSRHKIDPAMIYYTDMGIYKLLMAIEDNEILQEYYEKTLQPLVEYDLQNSSDLTAVLRCYLNHNGSVKEAAAELFLHRNTINYKLHKAQELLHTDLSSLDTRLQLCVGFMLLDMLPDEP